MLLRLYLLSFFVLVPVDGKARSDFLAQTLIQVLAEIFHK